MKNISIAQLESKIAQLKRWMSKNPENDAGKRSALAQILDLEKEISDRNK